MAKLCLDRALQRAGALSIAALALGGLLWQFQVKASKPGLAGLGIRLSLMAKFYANIANMGMGVGLPSRPSARAMAGRVVLILTMRLICQAALAADAPLPAPHWYQDFGCITRWRSRRP